MDEKRELPDLKDLCLHSICRRLLFVNRFYDIKSTLNFFPPQLVDDIQWYYQTFVQPQIGKWRRCHWRFFTNVQQYFSLGGPCEICRNGGEKVIDIVTNSEGILWTPYLTVDYARTASSMSERIPKTCSHLSMWSVPNCDPTTCRDGLEFDSEIM